MKEALKLALDLAIMHHSDEGYAELRSKVRQLAKEALAQPEKGLFIDLIAQHKGLAEELAQPEQEPVATVTSESENPDVKMSWWHEPALTVGTKLYTTPPKRPWVGLTDEQREACTQSPFTEDNYDDIEDKLKELNT